MLQLEYVPLDAASLASAGERPDLLAVLGFPALPQSDCLEGVAADRVDAGAIGAGGLREVWASRGPVRQEIEGAIRYSTCGDFLFGVAAYPEGAGAIRELAEQAYAGIFALLGRTGFIHALRFWNYFPRINEQEGGIERYRLFNVGRAAAFESAGRYREGAIPAACALGTGSGGALTVYFVAAREPGIAVENPRQVSAYRYPAEYGPRSPTFSRAVLHGTGEAAILFVSGTASIVGHRTLHAGDVVAQARETLANLEAVFAEAERLVRPGAFPRREASYKVYVRRPADLRAIQGEVAAALGPEADVTYLRADICRSDLLVEIEAIAFAAGRGGRPGR